MRHDVYRYVDRCQTCQESKEGYIIRVYITQSQFYRMVGRCKYGFCARAPQNAKGVDYIFVIVDRFQKIAHFICYKNTMDASNIANLYFREVVHLIGVSKTITPERDYKFLSHFWRALWKRLGTRLQYSSAYNPQTDGQTEVINKSFRNILRCMQTRKGIPGVSKKAIQ